MTGISPSQPQQPDHFWLSQIVLLANRGVPLDDPSLEPQKVFHRAMEKLFDHVFDKAPAQSLGKRITDNGVRRKIIIELWEIYSKPEFHNSRLLRSEFLRKLGKHDSDNDVNLKSIERIIKKMLLDIPNGKEFIEDSDFLSVAKHIGAAVISPNEFQQKDFLMKYLPESQKRKFSTGFAAIEEALRNAKSKEWFYAGTLNAIIKDIESDAEPAISDNNKKKLDRGTVHPFIVYHSMRLIESGNEDRETFKQAILVKIKEFATSITNQKTQLVASNL